MATFKKFETYTSNGINAVKDVVYINMDNIVKVKKREKESDIEVTLVNGDSFYTKTTIEEIKDGNGKIEWTIV